LCLPKGGSTYESQHEVSIVFNSGNSHRFLYGLRKYESIVHVLSWQMCVFNNVCSS